MALLREVEQAEAHVAAICFKTGPPDAIGVELEWTLHASDDPARPLDATLLRRALGPLAPPELTRDSPHLPLCRGGAVSLEPGGQLEISSRPWPSIAALHAAVEAEIRQLSGALAAAGLRLGGAGLDPYRLPQRLLLTPRYDAMARSFARHGPAGEIMMCSTAALQVCVDAGANAATARRRWAAVHELGPVLLAAFANSPRRAGRPTGWASGRMRAWLEMDPARTGVVESTDGAADPALAWARYALRAPVLCVRTPRGAWQVPDGVSFAGWIAGALPGPPTVDDLEYHLSTLFPPVRPRGYLEVRYLDAQPPGEWFAPVCVLAALLTDDATLDAARALGAPAAGRWLEAARSGLADERIATTAKEVLDLACRRLDRLGLAPAMRRQVTDIVSGRLPEG